MGLIYHSRKCRELKTKHEKWKTWNGKREMENENWKTKSEKRIRKNKNRSAAGEFSIGFIDYSNSTSVTMRMVWRTNGRFLEIFNNIIWNVYCAVYDLLAAKKYATKQSHYKHYMSSATIVKQVLICSFINSAMLNLPFEKEMNKLRNKLRRSLECILSGILKLKICNITMTFSVIF